MQPTNLLIAGDSTSESSELLAIAIENLFTGVFSTVRRFDIAETPLAQAVSADSSALLIFTLLEEERRAALETECRNLGVPFIDLAETLFARLEETLGAPIQRPSDEKIAVGNGLLKKIRAIEFTAMCDDGRNEELASDADLVLLGVSRTGKTPLSVFMAQKGLKTSNFSIVPEREPPEVIRSVPSSRLVGLDISTESLSRIRINRLRMLDLEPSASAYADTDRVERELKTSREYFSTVGARVCDVTDKSMEETAQEIMEYLRSTKP
ncbi:MAG: kinase/pyrophosphorylase [Aminobacteriaceae bacterium]